MENSQISNRWRKYIGKFMYARMHAWIYAYLLQTTQCVFGGFWMCFFGELKEKWDIMNYNMQFSFDYALSADKKCKNYMNQVFVQQQ